MTKHILTFLSVSVFSLSMVQPALSQGLDIPEDGVQEIILDNLEAVDTPSTPPQLIDEPVIDEMEALIAQPEPDPFLNENDATLKDLLPPESSNESGIVSVETVEPASIVLPMPETLANPTPVLPVGETLEMETVAEPKAPSQPKQIRPTFFDSEEIKFKDAPVSQPASAPKSIDPSKVVVVRKAVKADTQKARVVAAGRALALGRYESALNLYEKLYALNPRDPHVLAGRATALQKLGRFDESIIAYEELFDVDQNNIQAQVNMLGIMSEKYPSVALKRLKMLHEDNPENVTIVAQMGIAHGRLGSYEDAMTALGMAASMEPRNAEHLYNMAVISDRAEYQAEAMDYYEQALEIDSVYGGNRSVPREAIYERLVMLRN